MYVVLINDVLLPNAVLQIDSFYPTRSHRVQFVKIFRVCGYSRDTVKAWLTLNRVSGVCISIYISHSKMEVELCSKFYQF